jgi:hypothetical protein
MTENQISECTKTNEWNLVGKPPEEQAKGAKLQSASKLTEDLFGKVPGSL